MNVLTLFTSDNFALPRINGDTDSNSAWEISINSSEDFLLVAGEISESSNAPEIFLSLSTLSLLLTTQETFVDNVNQDQTAQNVQSDI